MANADGSVIIETKMDTEGVKKGTKETKEELKGLGEEAGKSSDSIGSQLSGAFRKLETTLKALGIAKVAQEVYEFGKEAVQLGSDLEEVQNVVDVTFETMSDRVNQFAKDAQKSAGMSETMAKQYVGTFGAMADSFGFTEQEAYDMSTALTQLTGDVASFYNLSHDEAATKLKGVFTGETEALKELGVVMTQTALDSYAMANGFGKTTSAMTEQEKVILRYQFVMDQLSAASGDFVRTQDSWANQARVLALQWESFMATLGTGLIDMLLPGLQFLNEKALPALNEFAEGFAKAMEPKPSTELRRSLNELESAITSANTEFAETSNTVEVNARMAELYKQKLEELEATGVNTAAAQSEYAAIVRYLNEIYPELNLTIDQHTGVLDANSKAQLENLDAMKQRALFAAQEKRYTEMLNAWAEAATDVATAEAELVRIQTEREALTDTITKKTGKSIDELKQLYNTQLMQNGAQKLGNEYSGAAVSIYAALTGSLEGLSQAEVDVLAQILSLETEEEKLNDTIAEGKEIVEEQSDAIDEMGEAYDNAKDAAGEFADSQDEVKKASSGVSESVKAIRQEYNDAKTAAMDSINSQIGLFDELTAKSDQSAADIIANWESQKEAFDNYSANLQKAVDMGLDEVLVQQLSDGSAQSMAILNEFVNSTDASVDEINAAFRKVQESKDTVTTTMAQIQTDVAGKMAAIYSEINAAWGNAAAVVKRKIGEMQTDINNLQGRSVTIQVVTQSGTTSYSGQDMSLSNPSLGGYSLRNAPVPQLASGAVIPPNAPFLAVLGDQRRGTNIEAPLSTIQEAVANVMAQQKSAPVEVNVIAEGDIGQLVRMLSFRIDKENKRKGESMAKGAVLR